MRSRQFRRAARAIAVWAIILGCLPTGASAGPVASSDGKVKVTREEDILRIEKLLSDEKIAKSLARRGITPDEVRQKLEKMSDHEVHMMAERLETTKSGGSVAGVLVIILLVVLIVYLVKNT